MILCRYLKILPLHTLPELVQTMSGRTQVYELNEFGSNLDIRENDVRPDPPLIKYLTYVSGISTASLFI